MIVSSTNLETIKIEDQRNYRLSEIRKIKDYFNEEIQYQQFLTNKLSKYLTVLGYSDKILTVVLTVFSGTNIFAHVKGHKKFTWFDHICIFFIILFIVWNNDKNSPRNKVKKEKT